MKGSCPLNLNYLLPIKDVRKMIWKQLNDIDRMMVMMTHNKKDEETFIENGYSQEFVCGCTKYGYLELLKWMQDDELLYLSSIFYNAAKYNHINILEWANEKGYLSEFDFNVFSRNAVRCGNLQVLKWLYTKSGTLHCDIDIDACYNGYLYVLNWLKDIDFLFLKEDMYYSAIATNQLHVLDWLLLNGCPIPKRDTIYQGNSNKQTKEWIIKNIPD